MCIRDRVDYEDHGGQALHLADATERSLQALHLLDQLGGLLLSQALEVAVCLTRFELVKEGDALLDGDEVGEHAAEPAAVDVRLTSASRLLDDRLLSLLLGPDEQDAITPRNGLTSSREGQVQPLDGLGEVDDVDPVALREDERAHLGIPATGLMAEVDPGLQQLSHRNGGHGDGPPVSVVPPRA